MSQSRLASLLEAKANVAFGYVVSVAAGQFIYPLFDASITLTDNMGITLFFTVLSLARTYLTRRFFNWLQTRKVSAPEE